MGGGFQGGRAGWGVWIGGLGGLRGSIQPPSRPGLWGGAERAARAARKKGGKLLRGPQSRGGLPIKGPPPKKRHSPPPDKTTPRKTDPPHLQQLPEEGHVLGLHVGQALQLGGYHLGGRVGGWGRGGGGLFAGKRGAARGVHPQTEPTRPRASRSRQRKQPPNPNPAQLGRPRPRLETATRHFRPTNPKEARFPSEKTPQPPPLLACFMPGSSAGIWYSGVPPPIIGVGVAKSLRAGV